MTSPSINTRSIAPDPAIADKLTEAVNRLKAEAARPPHERSPLFPYAELIKQLRFEAKATIAQCVDVLAEAGLTVTPSDLSDFCRSAFPEKTAKGRGVRAKKVTRKAS